MFILGLPHRLMEDDIYDGVLIPKGSLVRKRALFITVWCSSNCVLGVCEYMVRLNRISTWQ